MPNFNKYDNMPGKIDCIPINLWSMTKMMFDMVSE